LSLASEIEYFGLGAGAQLGAIVSNPWGKQESEPGTHNAVYLELKLRLLSGNIRL
jgi:hypothetical protein